MSRAATCSPSKATTIAPSPTITKPSGSPRTCWPITIAGSRIIQRRITTNRSPITARRFDTVLRTRSPTPIAGSRTTTSRTTILLSPITTKRSASMPSQAITYSNRGLIFAVKNDYDRAIADYNEAIRLDPGYAIAYFNRGLAYANKNELDRAIADYGEAIKNNSQAQRSLFQSRQRLLQQGRLRSRHRGLQRGDQAKFAILTRLQQPRPLELRQEELRSLPSTTTRGDQASIRNTPPLSTIAATSIPPSATTTAPSAITARRSGSIRRYAGYYSDRAIRLLHQERLRPRHRRLQRGDQARSAGRLRLRRSRRRI